VASGEHLVDVLLHGPRRAHPPAGHLVDDHIGPEEFFDFFLGVVTAVDEGLLQVETGAVQVGQGGFVQGLVQATVGMGEFCRR
jgi:hypothetical protein